MRQTESECRMNRYQRCASIGAAVIACAAFTGASVDPAPAGPANKETPTVTRLKASGAFEVKLLPVGEAEKGEGSTLARMTIDKQFHGELEATSKGQMLTAMTETKGSAGYVAIERVTGNLAGKKGSFVLQHNATMDRGTPMLNIIVVPDSGTGDLTGLTGTMKINVAGGKHSYEFDWAIPAK